ncbi:MAG: hypothetical protein HGA95_02810, partial [Caldiserica bacterium]|nr:hypothetical protein [Caldisericota bacterium]
TGSNPHDSRRRGPWCYRENGPIFLAAPTSGADRIRKIGALTRGFLYYVSVTGVTGARKDISATLAEELKLIRTATAMPLVVGFGISDPVQAGTVAALGDGAVVGSALVKLFEEYQGLELKEKVRDFVASLKAGIRAATSKN